MNTPDGEQRWIYIKFNTGALSVRQAKLRLWARHEIAAPITVGVYATTTTWGETTITWNTRPPLGALVANFSVHGSTGTWYEIDVTSHVLAEQAKGEVAFGVRLPDVTSRYVFLDLREEIPPLPPFTFANDPPELALVLNDRPQVTLTSPANGATFVAPANITLTATASDTDGTITSVEFYYGTTLITTLTAPPYTFNWTNVPQGTYVLTAKATDDLGATTTSAPVNITVNSAVAQLYFIHADHLNTPRLVADATGTTVWRWDQAEPFGNNPADENPSGLGVFDLPLRLPGQVNDKETNLHYNYFRNYDPSIGRYEESDPIGLQGGMNTYAYVLGNPLSIFDRRGLMGSRGNPKIHQPLTCEGRWVNKGWDREVLLSQLGIQLCFCYWLCESCNNPTLWSGVKTDLPSTVNFMWFDARKRDSRDGDVETGNACLCTRKPGPEKGCC